MSETSEQHGLADAIESLESDRDAIPWTQRRSLAGVVRESLSGDEQREMAVRLAHLLADDPKWEVRREIALLLPSLRDNEFPSLAAQLTEDSNGFVRKSAQRAMELRRKGSQESRRSGLDRVVERFELLDAKSSAQVRSLALRLYEESVAATVHDLRGVLTSACSQLESLQKEAAKPTTDVTVIRDGITKMSQRLAYLRQFVDAMGTYSQTVPLERASAPLTHLVDEATSLAQDAVDSSGLQRERVVERIEVNIDPTLWVAQHQIVTAISNVLKNAYDAVLFGAETDRTGEVSLSSEYAGDQEVRIIVEDTGMGISEDDLRELRTFVPGRTTKKGYGTGFGLPIAQKYIAAHDGALIIESSEGTGTTVIITLPIESQHGSDE